MSSRRLQMRRGLLATISMAAALAGTPAACGEEKSQPQDAAGAAGAAGTPGTAGAAGTLGSSTGFGSNSGKTPPQVDAPVTVLGPEQFQVEAIRLNGGWNHGYYLLGVAENHVLVCGCGGGQLASGCGAGDITDPDFLLSLEAGENFWTCGSISAWGPSSTDVYVPTDHGPYHFDGAYWSKLPEVTAPSFSWEFTGTAKDNFWIRGQDGIYHVTGTTAPRLVSSYIAARIQAAGNDELWGIEGDLHSRPTIGQLVHFTGLKWEGTGLAAVTSVSASSTSNVWAVNADFAYHFDGASWTQLRDPLTGLGAAPVPLREVWTSGPSDVWITGDDNILRHWTGGEWVLMPIPGDAGLLLGPPRGTPGGLWVIRQHALGSDVAYDEAFAFRITWP